MIYKCKIRFVASFTKMNNLRQLITSNTSTVKRVLSTHNNYLQLNLDNKISKYHYIWLRDHCRCDECYNRSTFQIASDVNKIPLDIQPAHCEQTPNDLIIKWKDGHETKFSLDYLKSIEFGSKQSKKEVVLWNVEDVQKFNDTEVPVQEFLTDVGVRKLLKSILKYGFGFVTGADRTIEATREMSEKVAFVQRTMFGEMWEVLNNNTHNDTAYTNIPLGAHTDNTYFTEACGLQIFHLLSHDGTGGETILVDGFNAAKSLEQRNKAAYDFLCNESIESEFIGTDVHYSSVEPVIKLHPFTNELLQIRYNIWDRANMTRMPEEKIMEFYKSYKLLGEEINSPKNLWIFKLEPGSIVFIDNFRVLHGRASYTGLRRLAGCYVGRGPWLSKARSLGLDIY